MARPGSGAFGFASEDKTEFEEEVCFKCTVQWGGFFIWALALVMAASGSRLAAPDASRREPEEASYFLRGGAARKRTHAGWRLAEPSERADADKCDRQGI